MTREYVAVSDRPDVLRRTQRRSLVRLHGRTGDYIVVRRRQGWLHVSSLEREEDLTVPADSEHVSHVLKSTKSQG